MALICAAMRSAIIPRGGAFAGLELEDIAAPVITALLANAGVAAAQVDEVICANALAAGGNPARLIALASGLGHVAGLTIDRQCVGGLDALRLAVALVDSGAARVVIAGGAESYSRAPERRLGGVAYTQARFAPRGWPDPDMATAADQVARDLGLTRAAQDAFAAASHNAARAADMAGEIVPIAGQERDAFARELTPALLRRAPLLAGGITAATAAVAADGAAFVLVVADNLAPTKAMGGLRLLGASTLGRDVAQPALAPLPAIAAAMAEAGLMMTDLAAAEVMEAYAAQALACIVGANLSPQIVNRKGGALARGHAIGASGTVLAVRLFHDLRPGEAGLAAIAGAGGLGAAAVLRRV